jgi:pyridoxine kinase
LLLEGDDCLRLQTPRLDCRPAGTGDLLTALIVARLATGSTIREALAHAAAAVSAVLRNTLAAGSAEMQIAGSASELLAPSIAFDPVDVPRSGSATVILDGGAR